MSADRNWSLNLGTWVRRLGFKRTDEPEALYVVQPVQVVSDATALTPALLAPQGVVGFNGSIIGAPPAGEFMAVTLRTRAEGGTAFRAHLSGVGGVWIYAGTSPPLTLATPLAPIVFQGPTTAIASAGTIGAVSLAAANSPTWPNGITEFSGVLPVGQQLIIQSTVPVATFSGFVMFEELVGDRAA